MYPGNEQLTKITRVNSGFAYPLFNGYKNVAATYAGFYLKALFWH
jgi:hypothetical protein